MKLRYILGAIVAGAVSVSTVAAPAKTRPLDLRDSFPIGSNGLCEAQIQAPQEGDSLFDRRYTIVCRDASAPVGSLYVVRGAAAGTQLNERFVPGNSTCRSNAADGPDSSRYICTDNASGIERKVLIETGAKRTYAATGISVYSDALKLGIRSLAENRVVEGSVDIPLTQAGDASTFARTQAEAISPDAALIEAYRRSNSGNFADAAEFFSTSADALSGNSAVEASLNEALQQSNVGNYNHALRIFNAQRSAANSDAVLGRLLRNFEALDALNRANPEEALMILQRPINTGLGDAANLRQLRIDTEVSRRLSAEQASLLSGTNAALTRLERLQLLDGQSDYLTGLTLRQVGQVAAAVAPLTRASFDLATVRNGRVSSVLWLRGQILSELAEVQEQTGQLVQAEASHRAGVDLMAMNYPASPALVSAQSQLAAFLARRGRDAEALTLYKEIVSDVDNRPTPTLRKLLEPYFGLLAQQGGSDEASGQMFLASQLMLRPGLAQTQAVLARELSGGSDEAAQLFRKALNISRAVERKRVALAALEIRAASDPTVEGELPERRQELERLRERQLETQQQLAAYPRYRAVSDGRLSIDAIQETLRDGEAYLKLVMFEDRGFAVFIDRQGSQGYAVPIGEQELEDIVGQIRDSIAVIENGQTVTYPFDLETSRDLYQRMMGPIADRLAGVDHLIFEPDGAMLKLPINLLVMDDASVDRYFARLDEADGDAYDYRGTAWLGREMQVSTAVSPNAFRDGRKAPRSKAGREYIGFGQNTPIGEGTLNTSGVRSALAGGEDCRWAEAIWANPIKADELFTASNLLPGGSTVVTQEEFTDSAIKQRQDLSDYRILHFATHGLVTAPQEGCPPRPALLTSFGAEADSDGLLSFAEIFDLNIDADLVVLSACDTAGTATQGATREAGVSTGGDFALDGLVRAFVGAGGRSVVASHWPVPDDFNATQRLVSGLFEAGEGVSTAGALQGSQTGLMDDANTSHPFYWSAFAIVGDGQIPVRR